MICYEKSCNSVALGNGSGLSKEMRNDGLHMCPLIAKTTRVMSMPYRIEVILMTMGLIFANIYEEAVHYHDDDIKWKHFPRYWPSVRGIHRSPVNSPCKGQWRGALMYSLICAWINSWVHNREAGDLRRHHAHYDVTVTIMRNFMRNWNNNRTREYGSYFKLTRYIPYLALIGQLWVSSLKIYCSDISGFYCR